MLAFDTERLLNAMDSFLEKANPRSFHGYPEIDNMFEDLTHFVESWRLEHISLPSSSEGLQYLIEAGIIDDEGNIL